MHAVQVWGGGRLPVRLPQKPCEEDPHCRLHGVATVNARLTEPHPPPPPTPAPAAPQRGEETPLDQRTQFLTRGGCTFSMSQKRQTNGYPEKSKPTMGRGNKDTQTGKLLSQEDAADYEVYLQRLSGRYRVGEQADRLVRVVDQCLPRIADENRAYVMRCPMYRAMSQQATCKLLV